jgi:hypothetical protein
LVANTPARRAATLGHESRDTSGFGGNTQFMTQVG